MATRSTDSQTGMNLRLAQLNAQGSRAVIDQVRQISTEQKIDIMLLQEPYVFANKIPGLELTAVTLTDRKKFATVSTAEKIKAAIVVFNKQINILKIEQLSNTHFICVEISTKKDRFYLVSAYFQHCEHIEPYLAHLERILNLLQGENIIICLDSNAKSTLWHSTSTDSRGELLEDLIAQHRLHIANLKSKIVPS